MSRLTKLQAVFLGAVLILSTPATAQLQQTSRLRLIPIVSDQRLEDIQESVDHTRLLTHDRGYAPRLWEPKSMRLLGVLPHNFSPVNQALLSSSGSFIVTVSIDEARIWDAKTARVINSWDGFESKSENFTRIAISSDDQTVAIAGEKGTIWIAKAPLYKLQALTALPSKQVISDLQISADATTISACTESSSEILTFNLPQNKLTILNGSEEGTLWTEISQDSTQLLATGLDNQARLFNLPDGNLIKSFPHFIGEKGMVRNTLMAALFVGQGLSEVLVCGEDGTMTIYDRKTLAEKRKLTGYSHPIREIRKSADGLRIATYEASEGDEYDPLKIWDVITTKEFPFNRAGGPTAGALNPEGTIFWVGYENGSIVKHRLSDGEWDATTISNVRVLNKMRVIPQTGRTLIAPKDISTTFFSFDARKVHFDDLYSAGSENLNTSQNGLYAISPAYYKNDEGQQSVRVGCWDIATQKQRFILNENFTDAIWVPDNKVIGYGPKIVALFDPSIDEIVGNTNIDSYIQSYVSANEKFRIKWVNISADGFYMVVCLLSEDENDATEYLQVVEMQTGDFLATISTSNYTEPNKVISAKNQPIIVFDDYNVNAFDIKSGEPLWNNKTDNELRHFYDYSKDSSTILHTSNIELEKLNPTSGAPTETLPLGEAGREFYLDRYLDLESGLLAITAGRQVAFFDINSLKGIRTITRPDTIFDAQFITATNRFLITDATDQTTIWDLKEILNDTDNDRILPLGSFILMRRTPNQPSSQKDAWLIMDREGRFDAPDPNNVTGASYVLEWDGGLEPIDITQLKSLYYEPGLFAKLLGIDPEKPRAVPDRKSIRLFPEITIEKSKSNPNRIQVSLTDRDEGGIGKTEIYLNNKLIDTKVRTGFININLEDYKSFFLPKAQLPEGQGNILSIVSSNKRGDLKSLPATLDVGVPENLAIPQVNIYGLFVGVGNYAGAKKDLSAPPMDAIKLSEAIGESAERLLPKHVHITTLTTDNKDQLPNRQTILDWFNEVATKATSSDIIVVFLAGHGTSQIGDQSGYFFLTAGADPADVTPSILGIHTISGEDLKAALAKIPASKQVIILDTCHSGAAAKDIVTDRASGSDYIRAYESIRDSSGTWLLAGAAADQLSYESRSVDHGLLTYSLLEAIDRVTPDGLRATPSGELFLDVDRWFNYAATRVESLRNEIGIDGVQKPEVRKGATNQSFDLGVTREQFRGEVGLKPPKPIVLMGTFDFDQEDPLKLETAIADSLRDEPSYKLWLNIAKHPKVFRIAGSYTTDGDKILLRLFIQQFNANLERKNLKIIELSGVKQDIPGLILKIKESVAKELPNLINSPETQPLKSTG